MSKELPLTTIDSEKIEIIRDWATRNNDQAEAIQEAWKEASEYARVITQAIQGVISTEEATRLNGLLLISSQFTNWIFAELCSTCTKII